MKLSNDLELLIAEMNAKITALSEKVAYLERLENAAVDGTGPYVLRTGDTMTGRLLVDPTTGATSGLLAADAPSSNTSNYTLKLTRAGSNIFFLRDDGYFLAGEVLYFSIGKGIASDSSGAGIFFPTGGGSSPGNINIDSSGSNGLRKAVAIFTPIGNGLFWSYDGVDGTARTAYDNGTDDVLYGVTGQFFIRDSAGNIAGGQITVTAPSGTFNLYDDGGTNTCQLQVNADGSVTVQRTAGSRTYKVMLFLIWI